MDSLIKQDMQLPSFSSQEFNRAQENLSRNMKQKSFFREKQFYVYDKATISEDFSGENHRRLYFLGCKFIDANLTSAGFSGTIFKSTSFSECILDNTKLDSCEFDDCNFYNFEAGTFSHVNFSKSMINNSFFRNCKMDATNFTDTAFENVLFENCEWKSPALENTIFSNTKLNNVDLIELNFEFAQFHNISMDNTRLPFATIPYIYNGLTYLMNTLDNVWISSAQSSTGKISKDEYLSYLTDLEIFYCKTQNYFPLANIYIAKEQWSEAYSAILNGLKFSINLRNFRLVNYYCKLLQLTDSFSDKILSDAYKFIMENIDVSSWRPQDHYNYSQYIDVIRSALMNERTSSSLQLLVSTNILSSEYEKLTILLSAIDDVTKLVQELSGTEIKCYAEVRHNSPFELFIKFFGLTGPLLSITGALYFALWGSSFLADKIMDYRERCSEQKMKELHYQKELERQSYYKEMAKMEYKEKAQIVRKNELEIALKENELKAIQEEENAATIRANSLEIHEKLNLQAIMITSGGHTLFDHDGEINDAEIMHYYK